MPGIRPSERDATASHATASGGVRAMELGHPRLRRCRSCQQRAYVGDGVCVQTDCWRNDDDEVSATVLRWLLWQVCRFLKRRPGLLWHPTIEILVFTLAGLVRDLGGEHLLRAPPSPADEPGPRPPPPQPQR